MAETNITKTAPANNDASLGELVGELSQEGLTLVRQEIELAKTEMTEKMNKIVKDLVYLAAGGAVAYLGLLFILAAIAAWLGGVIDLGMSAAMSMALGILIVGVVVAIIGYVLVQKGMNEIQEISPVPKKTIESLKEDKEWAQRQV